MSKIPEPLNTSEKYLYAIAIRLDALCNMMSSFLETYAKHNQIATTSNTVTTKTTRKRSTKKVSE